MRPAISLGSTQIPGKLGDGSSRGKLHVEDTGKPETQRKTLSPMGRDDSRADAAKNAVGLADFARKHAGAFGRIELVRVENLFGTKCLRSRT